MARPKEVALRHPAATAALPQGRAQRRVELSPHNGAHLTGACRTTTRRHRRQAAAASHRAGRGWGKGRRSSSGAQCSFGVAGCGNQIPSPMWLFRCCRQHGALRSSKRCLAMSAAQRAASWCVHSDAAALVDATPAIVAAIGGGRGGSRTVCKGAWRSGRGSRRRRWFIFAFFSAAAVADASVAARGAPSLLLNALTAAVSDGIAEGQLLRAGPRRERRWRLDRRASNRRGVVTGTSGGKGRRRRQWERRRRQRRWARRWD